MLVEAGRARTLTHKYIHRLWDGDAGAGGAQGLMQSRDGSGPHLCAANSKCLYAARGHGFPDSHPGPGEERVGGKQQSLRGREGGKGGRQCEVASLSSAPPGYSELPFFWCLAQGLARSGCSVGAL